MAIAAAIGANLARGIGHGPVGAVVSACPRRLLRTTHAAHPDRTGPQQAALPRHPREPDCAAYGAGRATCVSHAPALEQTVRAWHDAGRSRRAIARELSVDRRKIKQIIGQAAAAGGITSACGRLLGRAAGGGCRIPR